MMTMNAARSISILLMINSVALAYSPDSRTEITPFTGYGFGGEFEEITTDTKLSVDEEQVYGVIVDWGPPTATQYEFLFSHQQTQLSSGSGLTPPEAKTDLNISYAHVGGVLNFGDRRVNPFFGGGLGLTHFNPSGDYSSKTKFSINLGGGLKYFFTDAFGIRLEGRGYATLVDNTVWFHSGSNGAQVAISGDVLWQFQLNLGLTFSF